MLKHISKINSKSLSKFYKLSVNNKLNILKNTELLKPVKDNNQHLNMNNDEGKDQGGLIERVTKEERIGKLQDILLLSNIDHEKEIMQHSTLKFSCIYSLQYKLTSQVYGPLLEKYIMMKYNYNKNRATDCAGDCSKNTKNIEIKISLGGSSFKKFNFVQIRLSHNCDFYLLVAYHLCPQNVYEEGELYIFKVSKHDMKQLIVDFGSYAHGTISALGKITEKSINSLDNIEYALRPSYNSPCWKQLVQFRIYESDL